MLTSGGRAFLQRWLRVSVLAIALAIAQWLWSRRNKNRLEKDDGKTLSAGVGTEACGAPPTLHAGMSSSLAASTERRILTDSERASINYRYDCFLSHKRSDCHDICLRISDNLKFKGVLPFIDRECLGGLDSLAEQVRSSRVFFLFLTNNVFESAWCMMELVEADKAGAVMVPVLVEGASWGLHGARKFPDVETDCLEEYEPMPGMKVHPRAALRRMFSSVAIDLSRTYFDPFVDKLASRVESAGGGNSAAGQLRRMDAKVSSAANNGVEDAETAEGFWRSSLGGVEQCSWLAFEGALRTFLADEPTTLEAVLVPLEGAVCDHSSGSRVSGGTVNFSALAATFAGGNFKDTLRAMASEASAAEVVFDIVVRVPVAKGNGSHKDYVVDDERSTSFVMVKSSDTLARVRQTIVDAFMGDDYGADDGSNADSDSGLDFLGEGKFSFVFQVGAGKSGKTSGAVHWTRARRQQERRVTAIGLTNLSVVEDDKAASIDRRDEQEKPKETAKVPAEGSFQSRYTSSAPMGGDEDDLDDSGGVQTVKNPVEFALAAGVLHQAKVRAAEALTTSDVMADKTLSYALGAAVAARGGSEQAAMLCKAAQELKENPKSIVAQANLISALPNDVGAAVAAGGPGAASAAADAALLAAADLASPLADLKAKVIRAHRGKSAPSDGLGGKQERVVVLGGGFAGCTAAAKLDRHPNLHVTIVDTKEYFENTPAVLRCMSEENHEMFDLCHVEHKEYMLNGSVVIGRATSVDEDQGLVYVGLKGSLGSQVLPFEYLLIGTGSRYPSNIKPAQSSLSYRRSQFKQERKRIAESSKVIVVGGGVVGTEMAGEVMSFFPDVPVELVTRSHCLLPRSRGAHPLVVSVLQDPKLEKPVNISYGETIDFAMIDHATNTVTTSKGRDLDLNGTRVVNCTGYTPNSDFLPRKWLDENGFILCTPQMEIEAKAVPKALRTSATSRFYFAMGDVCEESKFPGGERMAAVAHTHAYGITHSIMRLAEARAAARRAEAAEASSSESFSKFGGKSRDSGSSAPKLFKMDLASSTGVHSGIPWGAVSVGADHCVTRLDNPKYEGFAAAFFFDPEKVKEEQGPITNGWVGLGPSSTKFSMMGLLPSILRPVPDNMPMWDGFNADRMTEEDDEDV